MMKFQFSVASFATCLVILMPCAPLAVFALASSSNNVAMPPLNKLAADHHTLARQAMEFFNKSPDPFHAVQTSVDMLDAAGFQEWNEEHTVQPGGKYYFTRNKSTLVCFCVGSKCVTTGTSMPGFKVIGGHTDSPNLKVKPRSKRKHSGCTQIAVECYGGGLWHTWFDRDLGISGRVLVRNQDNRKIEQRLVKIDRAVLRISNLAIHLQTADERTAFKVNKEDHLSPILAMEVEKALTGDKTKQASTDDDDPKQNETTSEKDGWTEYQDPILLQILAEELGIETSQIADFELNLFDTQTASLGGAYSEFVHSARLDNLASCFLAVKALVDHVESGEIENDEDVSLVALFDHEEVGSSSAVGAGSNIMGEAVKRIASTLSDGDAGPDVYDAAVRKSFVLSVDQAHAVHPNYASKHEKGHKPKMNGGMVIKRNSNQRYATTGITGFIIREIARKADLPPVQEFVVRNDCACGSTIGPIISTTTGIRAIDMGCPQLSMHSIRETMGVCDLTNGLALFKAYFTHFREVDSSIEQ